MATPERQVPTGMVAITVFVAVAITDTMLLPMFATYANWRPPYGYADRACTHRIVRPRWFVTVLDH